MNDKVKQFTELCRLARTEGLTTEGHLEKKKLSDELISEGIMINDGRCLQFTDESDSEYFKKMIELNNSDKSLK